MGIHLQFYSVISLPLAFTFGRDLVFFTSSPFPSLLLWFAAVRGQCSCVILSLALSEACELWQHRDK